MVSNVAGIALKASSGAPHEGRPKPVLFPLRSRAKASREVDSSSDGGRRGREGDRRRRRNGAPWPTGGVQWAVMCCPVFGIAWSGLPIG